MALDTSTEITGLKAGSELNFFEGSIECIDYIEARDT